MVTPPPSQPFGYVDIEFAWHGTLTVGALVGGLGKVPGVYYRVQEAGDWMHLLEQFKKSIEIALEMGHDARLAAGQVALQVDFSYSAWSQGLEDQYLRSLTAAERHACMVPSSASSADASSLLSSETGVGPPSATHHSCGHSSLSKRQGGTESASRRTLAPEGTPEEAEMRTGLLECAHGDGKGGPAMPPSESMAHVDIEMRDRSSGAHANGDDGESCSNGVRADGDDGDDGDGPDSCNDDRNGHGNRCNSTTNGVTVKAMVNCNSNGASNGTGYHGHGHSDNIALFDSQNGPTISNGSGHASNGCSRVGETAAPEALALSIDDATSTFAEKERMALGGGIDPEELKRAVQQETIAAIFLQPPKTVPKDLDDIIMDAHEQASILLAHTLCHDCGRGVAGFSQRLMRTKCFGVTCANWVIILLRILVPGEHASRRRVVSARAVHIRLL